VTRGGPAKRPSTHAARSLAAPRRTYRVSRSCTAAIALLAACLVQVSAAEAARNPETEIRALSHAFPIDHPAVVSAGLAARKAEACDRKGARRILAARKLSLARALANAERFLARKAGKKALTRLYSNRALRKPAGAVAVAAGGIATANPAGALAALLKARKLAPKDPDILVNMAPLLTHLGLAPEAIAVLDAADRMRGRSHAAMGLKPKAVALNNRGQALLGLGQWNPAAKALTKALALDPVLNEAATNLAAAELCRGKAEEAVRFFRLGQYRRRYDSIDAIPPSGEGEGTGRRPVGDWIDLSKGIDNQLPQLPLPRSVDQTEAAYDSYLAEDNAVADRLNQVLAEESKFRAELSAQLAASSPATRARTNAVMSSAPDNWLVLSAAVRTREAELSRVAREWSEESSDAFPVWGARARDDCEGVEDLDAQRRCMKEREREYCTAQTNPALSRFNSAIRSLEESKAALHSAGYRHDTAAAATLKRPAAHGLMLALARERGLRRYSDLTSLGSGWSAYQCDAPRAPADAFGEVNTPGSSPCQVPSFSINLRVAEVSADCENIEAKIATEGALGAFLKVSHGVRSGETTVFAGPQGEVKIPGTNIGATIEDGLYIKVDRDGNLKDIGFRVAVGGTVGAGAVSISTYGESYDFSFVGVFSSLPSAFGSQG